MIYVTGDCHAASILSLIGQGMYAQDILTKYLEEVQRRIKFKKFLFGHMHENRQINSDHICLYEQIIRIA